MKIKDFFGKIKKDKDFRFDFIIGVWSAVIIIVIIAGVIFLGKFLLGKGDDNGITTPTPTPEVSEEIGDEEDEEPTASPEAEEEDEEETDETGSRFSENIDGEIEFEENENSSKMKYATTTVNVRSNPDTTAAMVGKLAGGESVEVVEVLNNGWTKVKYKGSDAYVKSDYLTDSESTYSAPTYRPQNNTTINNSSATNRPAVTPKPKVTSKPKATVKPKTTKKPQKKVEEDYDYEDDDTEDDSQNSNNDKVSQNNSSSDDATSRTNEKTDTTNSMPAQDPTAVPQQQSDTITE